MIIKFLILSLFCVIKIYGAEQDFKIDDEFKNDLISWRNDCRGSLHSTDKIYKIFNEASEIFKNSSEYHLENINYFNLSDEMSENEKCKRKLIFIFFKFISKIELRRYFEPIKNLVKQCCF